MNKFRRPGHEAGGCEVFGTAKRKLKLTYSAPGFTRNSVNLCILVIQYLLIGFNWIALPRKHLLCLSIG